MQNRTDFNAELLFDSLMQYEQLNDKVSLLNSVITIVFHKYFKIIICDDFCEFFDTHWHPNNNDETLQFVDDLLAEKYIFFHRYKFPHRMKRYKKQDLPRLLKTKNKKFCRVYSAINIYIDN